MVGDKAIDEITDLAEAMNKFGPGIIVLAVLLLVFLAMIIWMLKSNQSANQQMMAQQQQLIDNLLKQKEEKETKEYDEKQIVGIFYKLNSCLKMECKKFLSKTECNRIGIYVFHNGTVASHGLPFFKVSCVCEHIRRESGIRTHITDSTNLPLTLFDDIIEKLYTEGTVIVQNNEPGKFHSDSFFLDKDKALTAVFTTIYDNEDNAMAFILGEYIKSLTQEEIDHDIMIYKELCARLKPVLEYSDYQSAES